MKYLLKCPYCGFEEDSCFFPDLFYQDSENTIDIKEQLVFLNEIQSFGYNIVTCGECGQVFIERVGK